MYMRCSCSRDRFSDPRNGPRSLEKKIWSVAPFSRNDRDFQSSWLALKLGLGFAKVKEDSRGGPSTRTSTTCMETTHESASLSGRRSRRAMRSNMRPSPLPLKSSWSHHNSQHPLGHQRSRELRHTSARSVEKLIEYDAMLLGCLPLLKLLVSTLPTSYVF